MPRGHLGDRVARTFDIPVELDEWLTATARPGTPAPRGPRLGMWPTEASKNHLVTRAIYLLRELMAGIPSPASATLMEELLDELNLDQYVGGPPRKEPAP